MFKDAIEKLRNIAYKSNQETYNALSKKKEMIYLLNSIKLPFCAIIFFILLTMLILLEPFGEIENPIVNLLLVSIWLLSFNGTFVYLFVKLKGCEDYCSNNRFIEEIKKEIDLKTLTNQNLSLEDLKLLKEELIFIRRELSEEELLKVLIITKKMLKKEVGDLAFFEYLFKHYNDIQKQALNFEEKLDDKKNIYLFDLFKKAAQ